MSKTCFYHGGCPDGFGAAWSVWTAWGPSARYVPIGHDDRIDPEQHEDSVVTFVDIVPAIDNLLELSRAADQVIVLDHHITSLKRYRDDSSAVNGIEDGGHTVHFDLSHSGAVLAWNFFHPEEPPPQLLLYVEDQDLWNWKLPRSQEVNAAIASYPHDFATWSELAERPVKDIAAEGSSIVRSNRMQVARALHHAHSIRVDGRPVMAVNSAHERAAIGHELAKRADHAAAWGCVYRIQQSTVFATLYSIGDLDISKIATSYGGGGHRNAAGFSVPLARWLDEFA